jgi:trimethylamine:corrinoid methyltransferase-like protein
MGTLKLQIHTPDELKKLDRTALRILEDIGIKVEHEPLRRKLKKASAMVNLQHRNCQFATSNG